jgi:hypothetical protein
MRRTLVSGVRCAQVVQRGLTAVRLLIAARSTIASSLLSASVVLLALWHWAWRAHLRLALSPEQESREPEPREFQRASIAPANPAWKTTTPQSTPRAWTEGSAVEKTSEP